MMTEAQKKYQATPEGRYCLCGNKAKRFHYGFVCERCDEIESSIRNQSNASDWDKPKIGYEAFKCAIKC